MLMNAKITRITLTDKYPEFEFTNTTEYTQSVLDNSDANMHSLISEIAECFVSKNIVYVIHLNWEQKAIKVEIRDNSSESVYSTHYYSYNLNEVIGEKALDEKVQKVISKTQEYMRCAITEDLNYNVSMRKINKNSIVPLKKSGRKLGTHSYTEYFNFSVQAYNDKYYHHLLINGLDVLHDLQAIDLILYKTCYAYKQKFWNLIKFGSMENLLSGLEATEFILYDKSIAYKTELGQYKSIDL